MAATQGMGSPAKYGRQLVRPYTIPVAKQEI